MTQLLTTLSLLAALVAAPVSATQPDPHVGHHPTEAADTAKPAPRPDAKPGMHACPMMDGKTAGVAGAPEVKAPDGKMMMDGKDMPCMPASTAGKAAKPPHDGAASK